MQADSKSKQFLELLKTDAYISGQTLARKIGISRSAVWKQIRHLREYGYSIESLHGVGYKLVARTDYPVSLELSKVLRTSSIGKQIFYKEIVDSTQSLAISLVASGKGPHGTVIIAEQQKSGRGRLKRKWLSPKGGLWLSIILQPSMPASRITLLPFVAALATCDSIVECTGLDAWLKWPNDIMIHGKKIAGILLDISTEAEKINYAIIGIGINANVESSLISSHLWDNYDNSLQPVTSIKDQLGHDTNRLVLTQILLEKLEQYYLKLEHNQGAATAILYKWKERSDMFGRQITVISGNSTIQGIASDVNHDGSLVLKTDTGNNINITSGDIRIRY